MYSQAHQLVSVIGDSYGQTERWQFGFRITTGGVSNQATADALKPIILKWWNGTAAPYVAATAFLPMSTHRLTEVKVANIDVDGRYPPTLPSASSFIVPAEAGDVAPYTGQLAQGTIAATLVTALPRGFASKGRIYLPPCNWQRPQADGLITATDAKSVADSVRILISEINADTVVGNVAVFSRGRAERSGTRPNGQPIYTYPNPGATNNVTGVRVGRVVDTQRRRRRSLTELPQTASGTV